MTNVYGSIVQKAVNQCTDQDKLLDLKTGTCV